MPKSSSPILPMSSVLTPRPDRHPRVGDWPASHDYALAHVDHLPGHEHVRHLVDLAVNHEGGDKVQAGVPCGYDFKVPFGGHSKFLINYVLDGSARWYSTPLLRRGRVFRSRAQPD